MQSFHLIPILCQNSAIKRLKHSPKVSAGKKVPVQSIGLTGIHLHGVAWHQYESDPLTNKKQPWFSNVEVDLNL